jgi:hypothetical protein
MFDVSPPLVLIGKVWELPSYLAESFIPAFKAEFSSKAVPTSGLRRSRTKGRETRKLIRHPMDYKIDWIGTFPTGGLCDYEPCARRRKDPLAPSITDRKDYWEDIYRNLAIPEAHWDRLLAKVTARFHREWTNMVGSTPERIPTEFSQTTPPIVSSESLAERAVEPTRHSIEGPQGAAPVEVAPPGVTEAVKRKQRRERKKRIEALIEEGYQIWEKESGTEEKQSMASVADDIVDREWTPELASSKSALAQKIRKGIAARRKTTV